MQPCECSECVRFRSIYPHLALSYSHVAVMARAAQLANTARNIKAFNSRVRAGNRGRS